MKVIPNLKYTDKHEWVKIDGEFAYIGITAYAQNQLGEVLFVEMPEVGDELNQGEEDYERAAQLRDQINQLKNNL